MLKSYAELGTVHRGAPCQEYPGTWLVTVSNDITSKSNRGTMLCGSKNEAITAGTALVNTLEDELVEYNPRDIGVCWQASDNDPRVGEVWFTGFYKLGHWNHFGHFREV
jgi:hypothetical protein